MHSHLSSRCFLWLIGQNKVAGSGRTVLRGRGGEGIVWMRFCSNMFRNHSATHTHTPVIDKCCLMLFCPLSPQSGPTHTLEKRLVSRCSAAMFFWKRGGKELFNFITLSEVHVAQSLAARSFTAAQIAQVHGEQVRIIWALRA